jgi:hypothetical protein
VGVEPTGNRKTCRPPVLKTGTITGPHALPRLRIIADRRLEPFPAFNKSSAVTLFENSAAFASVTESSSDQGFAQSGALELAEGPGFRSDGSWRYIPSDRGSDVGGLPGLVGNKAA